MEQKKTFRLVRKNNTPFLILDFDYDPDLVALVKQLPFARWLPETKTWRVLAERETAIKLMELGFVPEDPGQLPEILNYNPWNDVKVIQEDNIVYVDYPLHLLHLRDQIKTAFQPSQRRWNNEKKCWEIEIRSKADLEKLRDILGDKVKDVVIEKQKIQLIIHGSYGVIKGWLDEDTLEDLDAMMRFRPEGFEFSTAYQNGLWDGYIRLFIRREKRFPIGFLDKVVKLLEKRYDVEIIDKREETGKELYLVWNFPHPLRDYQKEVIQKALENRGGYICLPTGSGKTIIALRIIYELKKPAFIIVHRKELLYQWARQVEQVLGVKPGLIGDNNYEEKDITVAMVQTAIRRPPEGQYDVLIADECHHIPADTFYGLADLVQARYRFGLSATPWREDKKDLMIIAQLGKLIAKVSVEKLVSDGHLAKPKFIIVWHNQEAIWKMEGANGSIEYNRIYKEYIVKGRERNKAIVKIVKKLYEEGHKIYVDVKRIEHGRTLERMLREAGVKAIFISGESESKRRQIVLKNFEQDGFVLISTLIKEGVDLPAMTCCVLAGGGKSSIQVIQTIGRALRPKKGTNEALIVDFKDGGDYMWEHYINRTNTYQEYYGVLYKPIYLSSSDL